MLQTLPAQNAAAQDPLALPPHRHWNRGGDRPVLALHCSLAHAGAWSGLAEALHGVTITAMDFEGHGRARDWDGSSDLHSDAAADAVAMALEIGGGGPVDLFGHSFGGTVALRLAVERPDLVRSLMLVEPVLFAAAKQANDPAWPPFIADHRAFGARALSGDRQGAATEFHAMWGNGESFADLPHRMQDYIRDRIHLIVAPWNVILDDASGILSPGRLEAVQVPVLLVEGGDSPPIIAAVNRALTARLPRAGRLIVPGAGHMVPISHVSSVAPAVQRHLAAS